MRAIIHDLAAEREHWNLVNQDAEAELSHYRFTNHTLQAQMRQISMAVAGFPRQTLQPDAVQVGTEGGRALGSRAAYDEGCEGGRGFGHGGSVREQCGGDSQDGGERQGPDDASGAV